MVAQKFHHLTEGLIKFIKNIVDQFSKKMQKCKIKFNLKIVTKLRIIQKKSHSTYIFQ